MPSVTVKALNFWRRLLTCSHLSLPGPGFTTSHGGDQRIPTTRTARPSRSEGGGAPQSPPAGDLGSCLEEAEKSNRGAGARSSAVPGGRAPEPPPPRHPGCDPPRRPEQRAPRTGQENARAPGSFPRRHLVKGRGCHPPLPQRILQVPGSEAARRNESLALRARGGLEAPGPARPGTRTTGTRPDGGLPGAASPGSSEATHGPTRRGPTRPRDRMRRSCSGGVACSLLLLTLAGAGLRAPPAVPPPLPGCVSASPFRLPFSSSRVAALEFRGLLPRCRRRRPPPPPSVSSPQTAPAPHEPKHKHSGSGEGTASAGSAT